MKPIVLVTGGAGFIGTWIARELLRQQCCVVVFDLADGGALWQRVLGPESAAIEFVRGDIMDAAALGRALDTREVTHLIHLVGLLTPACQRDPGRGAEVNVVGAMRVFESVRARQARIRGLAYASSYAVHGPSGGTARSPETFYGAFKRAVELVAEQYSRHFGIHSVGLRPFVVYGAGREVGISAAPSLAARAVALGQPYTFGFSGEAGLVYVEDVARAFVCCALHTPSGAHVVDMPGEFVTMEKVASILERLRPDAAGELQAGGPPLPSTREEHPVLLPTLFPDWRDTPLEEGLRKTVAAWAAWAGAVATPLSGSAVPKAPGAGTS